MAKPPGKKDAARADEQSFWQAAAAQPADRFSRRVRAAGARRLLRSAAAGVFRHAAVRLDLRLGRADRAERPRAGASADASLSPSLRGRWGEGRREAVSKSPSRPKKSPSAPPPRPRPRAAPRWAARRPRRSAPPPASIRSPAWTSSLEDAESLRQLRRHRHRRGAVGADRERQPAAQERQALDAAPPCPAGEIRRRHRRSSMVSPTTSRPATSRPPSSDLVEGVDERRPHPGAARRHRLRQDLHHGQGDRGDAAPGADPGAQQDAGRPALFRVQELLPRERGRVFRLLLRLLPAGGLRPAHRHLSSRRNPRSTSRSTACATRRRARCSSATTSSSSPRSPASTVSARSRPTRR